jgi:hypothetical protein
VKGRRVHACALGAALAAMTAFDAAAAAATQDAPGVARAAGTGHRGASGSVEVDHPGIAIRAKPVRDDGAPLTIRVIPLGAGRSRVEYVGLVAGTHDLLPLLERTDGRGIDGVPPIIVSVETQLPPDAGTDLYGRIGRELNVGTPYRAIMVAAAIAWCAVPAVVLVRRALRRRPAPTQTEGTRAPTAVERLLGEVARAREAEPSVDARGRLELLLIQAVREAHGDGPGVDAAHGAARMRADPRTARAVAAVERWLHAPTPGDRATALAEIDALRLGTGAGE